MPMRKLIAFDDETLSRLTELARNRMGTLQEMADEAFADLLKKNGVRTDLRDALRKSAARAGTSAAAASAKPRQGRTTATRKRPPRR